MPRRVAVVVLAPPAWSPPGIDPVDWRSALADDLLDVLATLAEVDTALAVGPGDPQPLGGIGWPGLRGYRLAALDVPAIFEAATADGYEQAVLLAGDLPDLPGMLVAALLRPVTRRAVAAAPAWPPAAPQGSPTSRGVPGLVGLAARLPAPAWLPAASLDELTVPALRSAAPRLDDVAEAPPWHRLRGSADLGRLDPRLAGWDATRLLLGRRGSG